MNTYIIVMKLVGKTYKIIFWIHRRDDILALIKGYGTVHIY